MPSNKSKMHKALMILLFSFQDSILSFTIQYGRFILQYITGHWLKVFFVFFKKEEYSVYSEIGTDVW